MSDHDLTIDFGTGTDWPSLTLRCNAPAESLCHAVYTCACPEWDEAGIVHGRPYHRGPEEEMHYGSWKADECTLRDWLEGSDEAVRGAVTIPVTPRWVGDYYEFDVTPGAES